MFVSPVGWRKMQTVSPGSAVFPRCISLLLDHVHSRQLVWEKVASPQSRVIDLLGTHGGQSWRRHGGHWGHAHLACHLVHAAQATRVGCHRHTDVHVVTIHAGVCLLPKVWWGLLWEHAVSTHAPLCPSIHVWGGLVGWVGLRLLHHGTLSMCHPGRH